MPPRYQGEASTLLSWDTVFPFPHIRQGSCRQSHEFAWPHCSQSDRQRLPDMSPKTGLGLRVSGPGGQEIYARNLQSFQGAPEPHLYPTHLGLA